jgi:divalent metal cation (Fe/Co/Zn/Cd) transporter
VDIHVEVDGDLSVRRGHEIAHEVSDRLQASKMSIQQVMVHVEPAADAKAGRPGAAPSGHGGGA